MEKIFEKFKSPIAVILLLILIGGGFSYEYMKTSLFPDVTFPKIKVIAENGSQPVDKMMVTVTKPLENAIKQVPSLKLIRSTTAMGSCEISAFIEWGSDIDLAKQRLEAQIAQIKNDLPPDVQINVEKMNPSILPVMGFSLQSDIKTQVELKMLAEYTVKPFLSSIDGVSQVAIIGGKQKEYRIILDQQKMSLLKISVQNITDAIQQTGFIKSNGFTVDYKRLYLTVTDASLKDKQQLENLVISNDTNRRVYLTDVATVQIAAQNEYVKIKVDGKDVPLVAVLKQPTSNLIDVATGVDERVKELNNILPKGVTLKPYYDQADFVHDSIRSIIDVLWIGLLLAIVVVVIFLRSFKASSVVLITIPATLALTFLVLRALGFDFNIMTIGAIAASIGLIIDDAIIVIEQIHRTHEEFPDKESKELVGKAVKFLFPAMVSSSLSTIVIFIPFIMMSGVAGAYFKILTETMIITLVCSFVIVWLGLPVIYLQLSKNMPKISVKEVYKTKQRNWVKFFLLRPYMSFGFVVLLILSIIFVIPKLKTDFLPEMDEGSIVLDYNSPPGTSLEETDRMLTSVDKILEKTPEVETYSRRTGSQMGFFITEPNRGDYLIQLHKRRNRTTDEVSDDIRKRVEAEIPALVVDFGQVITDMLGDLMASVQPVEVKIFGNDHEKLKELSKQVADSIRSVTGTADVFDGIVIAGPVLKVMPKEDQLRQFGLNATDLQMQVQANLDGIVVGSIPEKEKLTNIRLIYPVNNQTPVEKLEHVKIFLPSGELASIKKFADFSIQIGVAEIERENLETMGVVTARLNDRDLGSVMKDIKAKISRISFPASYHVEYGGYYAQQQQSFYELLLILISGGLLVFVVILFMFRDLKLSIIIIFISILGISGSLLALFLTNTPLNVGSYTGLIMIIGIIGENSIFIIRQYRFERQNFNVYDSLVFAISVRLRPPLMTAAGAIVALLPLAMGIGTGAQMHQPLAIAVIGGLVIALPLLLIVLPSFLIKAYKD